MARILLDRIFNRRDVYTADFAGDKGTIGVEPRRRREELLVGGVRFKLRLKPRCIVSGKPEENLVDLLLSAALALCLLREQRVDLGKRHLRDLHASHGSSFQSSRAEPGRGQAGSSQRADPGRGHCSSSQGESRLSVKRTMHGARGGCVALGGGCYHEQTYCSARGGICGTPLTPS